MLVMEEVEVEEQEVATLVVVAEEMGAKIRTKMMASQLGVISLIDFGSHLSCELGQINQFCILNSFYRAGFIMRV